MLHNTVYFVMANAIVDAAQWEVGRAIGTVGHDVVRRSLD